MKKRTIFKPELITKTFFPGYLNEPYKINCGQCFMWAFLTASTFKGVELWDMDYHAFVKYKGKFYDSETLQGVKDPADLPACNAGDARITVRKRTVKSFKHEWRRQQARFKTSWGKMAKQARTLLVK